MLNILFFVVHFIESHYLSRKQASVYYKVLLVLVLVLLIWMLWHIAHNKKKRVPIIVLVCAVLFSMKLIPYAVACERTVQPELVAGIPWQTDSIEYAEVYFHISRFPFSLDSRIDPQSYYPQEFSETILPYMQDTSRYTYLISFENEIEEIRYNKLEGMDYLPLPWDGIVAPVDFSFGAHENDRVLIYRIPAAAIDAIF